MADDDLLLPKAPAAKPDDPEDVSWALSTAEAMWTRGEHGESIKWVRKAAEAAADAENDARALELAKAASDLAGAIARASSRSLPAVAPSGATVEVAAVDPALLASATTGSPPAVAPAAPRPPLPNRSFSPMPRPAVSPSQSFPKPPLPAAGRPPATPMTASSPPPPVAPTASNERARGAPPRPYPSNTGIPAQSGAPRAVKPPSAPSAKPDVTFRAEGDPTVVGNVNDLMTEAARLRGEHTNTWDAAETQSLSGDLAQRDGDRQTFFGGEPPPTTASAPVAAPAAERSAVQHDPQIRTSQAVRVVVWRDSSGVHIAPAGTVVSAITVDAVLVALEPHADLTAWLSQR